MLMLQSVTHGNEKPKDRDCRCEVWRLVLQIH